MSQLLQHCKNWRLKMNKILLSVCIILACYSNAATQPMTEPIKIPVNDLNHNNYQKTENPEVEFNKKNDLPRILAPDTMWTDDPRLIFTSFLGGNGYDKIYKSVFDKDKNTIHVGYSGSSNLKVTENAIQPYNRGTYDCLLAKFSPDGKPVFITYFGGKNDDAIWGCDVDENGNIYVSGWTRSSNFPRTDGSVFKGKEDAFISKFSPDGHLVWSKLLGDTAGEWGSKCRIMNNNLILSGTTMSPNFPVSENAYQKTIGSIGQSDASIMKMTLDGEIIWSTFFGVHGRMVLKY